jgi:hypothetical protein
MLQPKENIFSIEPNIAQSFLTLASATKSSKRIERISFRSEFFCILPNVPAILELLSRK